MLDSFFLDILISCTFISGQFRCPFPTCILSHFSWDNFSFLCSINVFINSLIVEVSFTFDTVKMLSTISVTCLVSCIMCHKSVIVVVSPFFLFFFFIFFIYKVVTLVGGGSVINGAFPSSFNNNFLKLSDGFFKFNFF